MCVNYLAQAGGSKVRGFFCVLSSERVFRFHMFVQSLVMSSFLSLKWFCWTVRSAFQISKLRSQCPNSRTDVDCSDTGIVSSNSSGIVLSPIFFVRSMRCSKYRRPWGTAEFMFQKVFLKCDRATNLGVMSRRKRRIYILWYNSKKNIQHQTRWSMKSWKTKLHGKMVLIQTWEY